MAGDQQASLVGQGCTRPGLAKATFGTGGMLDQCIGRPAPGSPGAAAPAPSRSSPGGAAGRITWGVEAMMLSAGTCVEWLRDDLGIIDDAADSADGGRRCADTGDVWFVPALLGLGTPVWDFGARGTFFGITRGSGRPEIVRAVLEGVAHRGADLLEAAEADTGHADRDRCGSTAGCRPTRSSSRRWPTPSAGRSSLAGARGDHARRRLLAGMAVGIWADEDEVAAAWRPAAAVEPGRRATPRAPRSVTGGSRPAPGPLATIPELSRPRLLSPARRAGLGITDRVRPVERADNVDLMEPAHSERSARTGDQGARVTEVSAARARRARPRRSASRRPTAPARRDGRPVDAAVALGRAPASTT